MNMAGYHRYEYTSYNSRQKFTVYINEGEKNQIENWVLQHDHIETGGDLFGLWIDDRTAVVQFVLGPGQRCRRTSVSFFQDIDYLREAGNYLTEKHGLCNIGQWHSHHRLGLIQPSGGDENTVWGNMPNLGLNRYIVCIATINSSYYDQKATASMNPYLFEIKGGRRNGVLKGWFEDMEGNSPFRLDKSIQLKTKVGAEKINKIKTFTNENVQNPEKRKRPHSENKNRSTNSPGSKQPKSEDTQHSAWQGLEQNHAKFQTTGSTSSSQAHVPDATVKVESDSVASTSQPGQDSTQHLEENGNLDKEKNDPKTSNDNQNSGLENNCGVQSSTIETGSTSKVENDSVASTSQPEQDSTQHLEEHRSLDKEKNDPILAITSNDNQNSGLENNYEVQSSTIETGSTFQALNATERVESDSVVSTSQSGHDSTQNVEENRSLDEEKNDTTISDDNQNSDLEKNREAQSPTTETSGAGKGIEATTEHLGDEQIEPIMKEVDSSRAPETSTQGSNVEITNGHVPLNEETENKNDGRQVKQEEQQTEELENGRTPEKSTQDSNMNITMEHLPICEETENKKDGPTEDPGSNESSNREKDEEIQRKDVEMSEHTELTEECFQDKQKAQQMENGRTPETPTQDTNLDITMEHSPISEEAENKKDASTGDPKSNESSNREKDKEIQREDVEMSEHTDLTEECFEDKQEQRTEELDNKKSLETSTQNSNLDITIELLPLGKETKKNNDSGSTENLEPNESCNRKKDESIQVQDVEIMEYTEVTEGCFEDIQKEQEIEESENRNTPETPTQDSNLNITMELLPIREETANKKDGSTEDPESNESSNREKDEQIQRKEVEMSEHTELTEECFEDKQKAQPTENGRTPEAPTQGTNLDITMKYLPISEEAENKKDGSTGDPESNESSNREKDKEIQREYVEMSKHTKLTEECFQDKQEQRTEELDNKKSLETSIQNSNLDITIELLPIGEGTEKNNDDGSTENLEANESCNRKKDESIHAKDVEIREYTEVTEGCFQDTQKEQQIEESEYNNTPETPTQDSNLNVTIEHLPLRGGTQNKDDGFAPNQDKTTSEDKQHGELERNCGHLLTNGKRGDHTELIEQPIKESNNRNTPETSAVSRKDEETPSEGSRNESLENHEHQLSSVKTDDDIVLAADRFQEGQNGQPKTPQKDAESKQNLDQSSRYNIPLTEDNDHNKTASESIVLEGTGGKGNDVKQLALNDEELSTQQDSDEEMPSESDDVQDVKNGSAKGIENQNAILKTSKQEDNPSETQVERMDFDNEHGATKVDNCSHNLTNPDSDENIVHDSILTSHSELQKEDNKLLELSSSDTAMLKEIKTQSNDDDIGIQVEESSFEQLKQAKETPSDETADQNVDNIQANEIEVSRKDSTKYLLIKDDVEAIGTQPTHGELPNSDNRRSRSIFDPFQDYQEMESTSEVEKNAADTIVGNKAIDHAFAAKETKQERKDSQDEEQDIKDESEEAVNDEFDKDVLTFESIDPKMDNGENKEIINGNQTKDENEKQKSSEASKQSSSKDYDTAVTKKIVTTKSIDAKEILEIKVDDDESNGRKVKKKQQKLKKQTSKHVGDEDGETKRKGPRWKSCICGVRNTRREKAKIV